MPIGVQIAARAFHDHFALAVARFLEDALGGYRAVSARAGAAAPPG